MATRDPYSRWNRLPPVYRPGEHRVPGPEDEPQRVILYLKGALLDLAERLAARAGFATVQEYCADLLGKAIEVERVKHHVADLEAKRGPLEGFNEVADDAGYLAEWRRQSELRKSGEGGAVVPTSSAAADPPALSVPGEVLDAVRLPDDAAEDAGGETAPAVAAAEDQACQVPLPPRPAIRITPGRPERGPIVLERIIPEVLDGSSNSILWSHVGPGHDLPDGFLPALRRGQAVPAARVVELLEALGRIEADHRTSTSLDRRLSYALHRLSLESQVLLTEAWPGVFDDRTVGAIRAVQAMVERILAGPELREVQCGDEAAAEGQT